MYHLSEIDSYFIFGIWFLTVFLIRMISSFMRFDFSLIAKMRTDSAFERFRISQFFKMSRINLSFQFIFFPYIKELCYFFCIFFFFYFWILFFKGFFN